MKIFFRKNKKIISTFLKSFFKNKEKELSRVYPGGGRDMCRRLAVFTTQGKMVRGSLVILSYLMFAKRLSPGVVKAAAAVELFHSALLIHDDIMDRDQRRRGKPTIFYQYQKLAQKKGFTAPYHFGISTGICAGDACFFLAFKILSSMKVKPGTQKKVVDVCSQELTRVDLAQIHEMYLSFLGDQPSERQILAVYKHKTARYTFSLPFIIGALLAGRDKRVITKLEKLGEYLGIMFQLKDDELGIYGSQQTIGKPVGSDIQEAKKTLYYFHLFNKAAQKDKPRLKKIFGKPHLTKAELKYTRWLIEQLGVQTEIDKLINRLRVKAERLIVSLPVAGQYKRLLREIMHYIISREK